MIEVNKEKVIEDLYEVVRKGSVKVGWMSIVTVT